MEHRAALLPSLYSSVFESRPTRLEIKNITWKIIICSVIINAIEWMICLLLKGFNHIHK